MSTAGGAANLQHEILLKKRNWGEGRTVGITGRQINAQKHPGGEAGKRPIVQLDGIKRVRRHGTRVGGDTSGSGQEGGVGQDGGKQFIHRINKKGLRGGGGRKIGSNVNNHGGGKSNKNGAPRHSSRSSSSKSTGIYGLNSEGDSHNDNTTHGVFKTDRFQSHRDKNFPAKGTEQRGKEILGIHTGRQEPAANRKGKAKAGYKGTFSLRGTPGAEVFRSCGLLATHNPGQEVVSAHPRTPLGGTIGTLRAPTGRK